MDANKAEEINLRLKQLVALNTLQALSEGYNIFPDEEDWDLERDLENETRARYQEELREATEDLDKLLKTSKD